MNLIHFVLFNNDIIAMVSDKYEAITIAFVNRQLDS